MDEERDSVLQGLSRWYQHRREDKQRGREDIWGSPFYHFLWMSALFPVCLLFFLLWVFPLCLPSLLSFSAFYHDRHSVFGSRESAPGSRCDKVMRRDVVIQQFQPKGHICSPSFALCICLCLSLPLLPLPFSISPFIYWIRSLQFLPECQWVYSQPILHKCPSEEISLDCWLFEMTHGGWFLLVWLQVDGELLHADCPADVAWAVAGWCLKE